MILSIEEECMCPDIYKDRIARCHDFKVKVIDEEGKVWSYITKIDTDEKYALGYDDDFKPKSFEDVYNEREPQRIEYKTVIIEYYNYDTKEWEELPEELYI
jgi:hypothetical protein